MANQTGGIAQKIEEIIRPTIEELGLIIWEVRFEKEGPEWFLRVLIDREEPMDTNACEKASRAIDPLLDKADLIDQSYYLEVGSPGLGRKLVRDEHFAFAKGQKVQAKLFRPNDAGEKEVAGILQGFENGVVSLQTDEQNLQIAFKDASSFKLCDDENLFGK